MDSPDVSLLTDADIENAIIPYVRGNYNEGGVSILNLKTRNGCLLGLVSQNGLGYGLCFMFSYYWKYLKLYQCNAGEWTVTRIG